MGFADRTFDPKKFARALRSQPDASTTPTNRDALTAANLNPLLYGAFMQMLREDPVAISALDFGKISDADLDVLEHVLYNAPANALFSISGMFTRLAPSAAAAQAFI